MRFTEAYPILFVFILLSCSSNKSGNDEVIINDSRFGEYIISHSSGIISKKDNISVRFSELVNVPAQIDLDELFDVEPGFDGSIVKTDDHSIVVAPEEPLTSGQKFLFKLKLNSLVDVPAELNEFAFRIEVIEQDFNVEINTVQTPDPSQPDVLEFDGLLSTADFAENESVEKMIRVDEEVTINWRHLSGTSHRFNVSGLKRSEQEKTLIVKSSGKPIGIDKTMDLDVLIPSIQEFSVISTIVEISNNPVLSVFFSDPLDEKQMLDGLIQLEGEKNPRIVIEGNQLKIFVSPNISGTKKLEISEGIVNSKGKPLGENNTSYVAFEPEKPQVKLIGNGSILPSSQGLVLPFEAVNLKAVQVEVMKIYEDNLPQFFQVNSLEGNSQLRRVGQQILSKKISLEDKASNLSIWNRFTLDLASLFDSERGALYQIRIGFRPDYTNYPCNTPFEEIENNIETEESWSIYQDDGFNEWGNLWEYRYPQGYTWQERDNPCHVSYYNSNRFTTTSLLATDLGLIAKIGGDNKLIVYATNMVTAQPVSASIQVFDYQLQELNSATTDADGRAILQPERRPFLVIAQSEGQKSYLKLADNESLSMSNFDVSGTRVEGNIKGFIYGERGVWRPGNNIYLSFMSEDPDNKIPEDHPVIMELRDPRGNIKDRQVKSNGINGLYTFQTKTEADDITGNWWATVKVGNSKFLKTVKVETIKPNRLKIDLDLGVDKINFSNRSLTGDLHANWLTGLTAGNLKAETELKLSEINTTFDGYAQYEFDDQARRFFESPKTIFTGQLDENGDAKVNLKLPADPKSPGALKAVLNTKVFEPGGGFSINTKTVAYFPYQSFVGINLISSENGYRIQRDEQQQLEVVTLNAEGKPIDRQGLLFELYKLNWRWWWDQSDDYSTNYLSSSYAKLVTSGKFSTNSGKGKVNFEISSPNWGRYVAVIKDPVSGHSASKIFYTSWYGDSNDNALGSTLLQVSTNKEEYAVGEKIDIMMRGSLEGQALVSIENGSSVLENRWIKTEREWTTYSMEVTPEMAPNVYVHVTLLQPHGQTVNDLPIRLYGITSVKVYDPETKLKPEIMMPDRLAPNEPVTISVSESEGKPMAYTLAIVDEGLLDITNFQTPDPWNHFFTKEAIGVKTWDIYDDVIGAFGGKLERLLAIGGGEGGLDDQDKQQENRFKPVVQFMGPFLLEAGKTKKHTFTMPQYIGSVKTMLVAGLDGAYGSVDKETPVVKPLMVLGTLPRVVGPGEQVSLPVNVFKYEDNIKNASISVEASGVLNLSGQSKRSIKLDESSQTLYFDLEVADELGTGKVIITATSGNEKSTHEINIVSRSPNSPQTTVKVYPIEPGKLVSARGKLFGMEGTNTVTLEVAAIPPINLEQRLKYLIRYPHGCIEQTISSVFPQLFLEDVTELSNEQKVRMENNINVAIEKLKRFQTSSGGLSYWPGYSEANSWGSTYAFHFLIESQKNGYLVPTEMMNKLRSYQSNQARNWTKSVDYRGSDLIQGYRLFTLAIAGYPEVGAMNRLRNTSGIAEESLFKLAAAYATIGQKEAARSLMANKSINSLSKKPYEYYRYTYGSFVRDLAILLETYVYLDNKTESFKVLKELSDRLSTDAWMSTQSTAYALLAVSKYVEANQSDETLKVKVSHGTTTTEWTSQKAVYQEEVPSEGLESLEITNQGEATLFATVTVTGTPVPGDEPVESNALAASITYIDINGRSIVPDSIRVGESFDILINIKNNYSLGAVRDIALTHILPSGWEIRNDRLNDQESGGFSSFDYQDIRDDRVYTYFHLGQNAQKLFKVSVTAAYPGRYYMPGVQAEAMYNASISAKKAGRWIKVVE